MDKILIIGAGPTGLGAAWRLLELGHTNFEILEASDRPGGLAASYRDDRGFLWDVGVHALHSHYPYFDDVLEECGVQMWTHKRVSAAWMYGGWVSYPVQYNVGQLPRQIAYECVRDMYERVPGHVSSYNHFQDYLYSTFGNKLVDVFLKPYNEKVWATPLDQMNVSWLGERVPPVDFDLVLRSAIMGSNNSSWGPNATFKYPINSGTGGMWARVAQRLEPHLKRHAPVMSIHYGERQPYVYAGTNHTYDYLINTMPLDRFIELGVPGHAKDYGNARELRHTITHVVGLGMKGECPTNWADFSWTYFPEKQFPFYRALPLSQYANDIAPDGHWSLLMEIAESPEQRNDVVIRKGGMDLTNDCIKALEDANLLVGQHIASTFYKRVEHGYPVPTLERDSAVSGLVRYLETQRVYSRGRFGLWKYEVSNMDHSFMQGVEVVDKIFSGKEETIAKF